MKAFEDLDLTEPRTVEEICKQLGNTPLYSYFGVCRLLVGLMIDSKGLRRAKPLVYRWPGLITKFCKHPPPVPASAASGVQIRMSNIPSGTKRVSKPHKSETVSIQGAIEITKLSKSLIDTWIQQHKFRWKIGDQGVLIDLDSLLAFVESLQDKAAS